MKLNKLLSLAVAVAAVSSLSAALDPDIAGKNGIILKQYAQVLKNRAAAPHHAGLAHTDTDELLQDTLAATGDSAIYIAAEMARARVRGITALTALGADGQNLLAAVIAGGTHPAGVTILDMKNAWGAEFDRVVAAGINFAHPVSGSHKHLQATIDGVDLAIQGAITGWIAALHVTGLAQANVLDAGRRAAIIGVVGFGGADTLQALHDYLQTAMITH